MLAGCCSWEALLATGKEGEAQSCLPKPPGAPYVRLPRLGSGRRVACFGTTLSSRVLELRRRQGLCPAGEEAPGLRPFFCPRGERLAGE